MLGKALMRQWTGDNVTGLGSAQADIRVADQVETVIAHTKPDWIALAAAYTDVDGCEVNPTLASAVNTKGAVNVAKVAAGVGSKLLFVSTDYVFDGKKTSPYETSDPRKGKCFPDTILKLASSRPEIEVVNDQRGCPTYTFDLADAIIKLCKSGAQGIIHCTNRGECSWFDFATEILRQSGSKTVVRPTTSDRFVRPAERPRYSVLSSASLEKYGVEMRSWQQTLPDYLRERAAA